MQIEQVADIEAEESAVGQDVLTEDFADDVLLDRTERRGRVDLRPYQVEANDSVCDALPATWRQLVVIATGGGKTLVAADLIKRLISNGRRALFLAHRDELIQQGVEKISWYFPEAEVEVEKGMQRASRRSRTPDDRPGVVVASKDSLHPGRLAEYGRDAFDLVICDETHHALAESYRRIFDYFGCFDEARRTPLVGITATPDRNDRKSLREIFQREAYRKDIADLIHEGYLCEVRAKKVNSETDLSEVKIVKGEFDPKALAEAVDSAERNALIVQSYLRYGEGRKAVVFAASVAHAQRLAELFSTNGVRSEAVWGMLERDERRGRLRRFADGETHLLANFAVLIEGWDEPSVACIILARPIRSTSTLLQIVGRGTRLFDGKSDVLIIDVQDVGKEATTVAGAFGLPNAFNEDDCSLAEAASLMKDLDPGLRDRALDIESLRKVHAQVAAGLDAQEIDILERREAEAAVKSMSELRWRKSGEGYVLNVSRSRIGEGGGTVKTTERYVLERNDLDQLVMRWSNGDVSRTSPETFLDERSAFVHWDAFIQRRHEADKKLIRNDEPWLSEPASKAQLEMLFGYGRFRIDADVPPGLSKAEAGDLISTCKHLEKQGGAKFVFRRVPEKYRTREPKAWTGPPPGRARKAQSVKR